MFTLVGWNVYVIWWVQHFDDAFGGYTLFSAFISSHKVCQLIHCFTKIYGTIRVKIKVIWFDLLLRIG